MNRGVPGSGLTSTRDKPRSQHCWLVSQSFADGPSGTSSKKGTCIRYACRLSICAALTFAKSSRLLNGNSETCIAADNFYPKTCWSLKLQFCLRVVGQGPPFIRILRDRAITNVHSIIYPEIRDSFLDRTVWMESSFRIILLKLRRVFGFCWLAFSLERAKGKYLIDFGEYLNCPLRATISNNIKCSILVIALKFSCNVKL